MKRQLAAVVLVLAALASSAWVIKESKSNTDVVIQTSPSGTPATALTVSGTSGRVTFAKGVNGPAVCAKSADYTILDTDGCDVIEVTVGASTRTMTLPDVATNVGRTITFKKVDTGAGKIAITRAGSATIDGATTTDIGDGSGGGGVENQWAYETLTSNGTNWRVTGCCGGEWRVADQAAVANFAATGGHYADLPSGGLTLSSGMWSLMCQAQVNLNTVTVFTDWGIGVSSTSGDSGTGMTTGATTLGYTGPTYGSPTNVQPSGTINAGTIRLTSATAYYCKMTATFSGGSGAPQYRGRFQALKLR